VAEMESSCHTDSDRTWMERNGKEDNPTAAANNFHERVAVVIVTQWRVVRLWPRLIRDSKTREF
jgi:hypothetical protein